MTVFRIMFYAGLVLAILFLIVAVMLFFLLHIPDAFGVVTGRTQKKAIEEMDTGNAPTKTDKKKRSIKARVVGASQDTGYMRARGIDPTATATLPKNQATKPLMSDDEAKAAASAAAAKSVAEHASTNITHRSDNIQLVKNGKMNLDEESTDILTYREMQEQEKVKENDSTEVLSEKEENGEESTDVLKNYSSVDEPGGEATGILENDTTDVLTDESDEEADATTDVLSSGSESDDGEAATDLLSNDTHKEEIDTAGNHIDKNAETSAHGEVHRVGDTSMYGSTNADQTSVLVEGMANGPEATVTDEDRNEKIRVLYKETIIHTDEFL